MELTQSVGGHSSYIIYSLGAPTTQLSYRRTLPLRKYM